MSYTLEFNEIATRPSRLRPRRNHRHHFPDPDRSNAKSPVASASADLVTAHDDLVRLHARTVSRPPRTRLHPNVSGRIQVHAGGCKLVECGRPSEIYSPLTGLTESWVKQHAELYEAMLTFCRSIECPCDLHILHNEIDSWTMIDRSEIHGLTECWINLVDFALNEGTDIESFDSDEVWESPSNNGEICI